MKLLELLACPLTKGPLVWDAERGELVSRVAKLAYPVRDGIPVHAAVRGADHRSRTRSQRSSRAEGLSARRAHWKLRPFGMTLPASLDSFSILPKLGAPGQRRGDAVAPVALMPGRFDLVGTGEAVDRLRLLRAGPRAMA